MITLIAVNINQSLDIQEYMLVLFLKVNVVKAFLLQNMFLILQICVTLLPATSHMFDIICNKVERPHAKAYK